MFATSLLLAIAPAIFLLIYFYKKDKLKPEPKGMIFFAFLLGIVSIIPPVILALTSEELYDIHFSKWTDIAIQSFVFAGFVEESSKFAIIMLFLFKSKKFDEVTDGIIYAVVVSLGFAAFENILYSVNDVYVAFLRAFTAVPAHAIFSGLMGYYIGLAKVDTKHRTTLIIKGLMIGILAHGAYDFAAFSGDGIALLIFPMVIVGFILLKKRINQALEKDKALNLV